MGRPARILPIQLIQQRRPKALQIQQTILIQLNWLQTPLVIQIQRKLLEPQQTQVKSLQIQPVQQMHQIHVKFRKKRYSKTQLIISPNVFAGSPETFYTLMKFMAEKCLQKRLQLTKIM